LVVGANGGLNSLRMPFVYVIILFQFVRFSWSVEPVSSLKPFVPQCRVAPEFYIMRLYESVKHPTRIHQIELPCVLPNSDKVALLFVA
jgi:hypothetical protein